MNPLGSCGTGPVLHTWLVEVRESMVSEVLEANCEDRTPCQVLFLGSSVVRSSCVLPLTVSGLPAMSISNTR